MNATDNDLRLKVGDRVRAWTGETGTIVKAEMTRRLKPYTVQLDDGRTGFYHEWISTNPVPKNRKPMLTLIEE